MDFTHSSEYDSVRSVLLRKAREQIGQHGLRRFLLCHWSLILMIFMVLMSNGTRAEEPRDPQVLEGVFRNSVIGLSWDPPEPGSRWEHNFDFEKWLTYVSGRRRPQYVYIRWADIERLEFLFFSGDEFQRGYYVDTESNRLSVNEGIRFSIMMRYRAKGLHIRKNDFRIESRPDGGLDVTVHTDLEVRSLFIFRHRDRRDWRFQLLPVRQQPPEVSEGTEIRNLNRPFSPEHSRQQSK